MRFLRPAFHRRQRIQGAGTVRFVVEDIIGPLGFAASNKLTPDNDAALCERYFFADLGQDIPARLLDGRSDEFCADVAFGEVFFHLPEKERDVTELMGGGLCFLPPT